MATTDHGNGSYAITDTELTYTYIYNFEGNHYTGIGRTNGTAYGIEYHEIDIHTDHYKDGQVY